MKNQQIKAALEVARYAHNHSPFYREHLAGKNLEDFETLPFLTGALLREQGERLLATSLGEVARIRTFSTSGSTGSPKRIFHGNDDLERTIAFFGEGMKRITPEGSTVFILMSDAKPGSIASLLKEGLSRYHRQGFIHGRPQQLEETIAALTAADCLVGMPADVYYLCKKAPELKIPYVLLSADYVASGIIRTLEELWQAKVYTHYGLTETCYGLAVQCPKRRGMHLRSDDFYLEIINPVTERLLPFGEVGEIVLTSLQKSVMPLIRYRTGDLGKLSDTPCPCGYIGPSLEGVYGRAENRKSPINIHRLDDLILAEKEVFAYEATLAENKLLLTIEGEIDLDRLASRLPLPVEVRHTVCPPWESSGKRSLHFR
ncbi:DVU_1553 family AMP-dependent CoA ligase [Ohessyouella blattaphilus]|uniref:AMP-binding protein n=1 Tax=Ohessyouella blattaphilus TaxID=2949333 RepID=A0ABT1EG19_9FIRM|nr:AMP-binding protein [Ohessyouella blattaphilus]MCP1109643.1 AMP-binding protein [Ohessyouella blattaphilus]MCR8563037.1 AMP-binding protein [Ohessyouella blattaphilus]